MLGVHYVRFTCFEVIRTRVEGTFGLVHERKVKGRGFGWVVD